jgi:hypothetical protein
VTAVRMRGRMDQSGTQWAVKVHREAAECALTVLLSSVGRCSGGVRAAHSCWHKSDLGEYHSCRSPSCRSLLLLILTAGLNPPEITQWQSGQPASSVPTWLSGTYI